MKKMVIMAAALALTIGQTQAALLANWGAGGVITVTDQALDENSGGAACDITSIRYAYQGGYHYFLMTASAAPDSSTFSEGYMLNFDYVAGGANANASYYVASGLVGIDALVDSHYFQNVKLANHYHDYIGGADPQFGTSDALNAPYNVVYNTGTVGGDWAQEWRVPTSFFNLLGITGQNMNLYGATMNPSVGGKTTYDITSPLNFTPVPEPGTLGLAGLAALMAAVRRRRK